MAKKTSKGMAIKASGGSTVKVDVIHRHEHHHYPETFKSKESSNPSMETIKEMIDAVIATTRDESTAERLEICRAYLFNPLFGKKIECLMAHQ